MERLYTVGRIGKLVRHAGTPQKRWGPGRNSQQFLAMLLLFSSAAKCGYPQYFTNSARRHGSPASEMRSSLSQMGIRLAMMESTGVGIARAFRFTVSNTFSFQSI